MERDSLRLVKLMSRLISTHTLTWSVTGFYCYVVEYKIISTHTLTWSVTAAKSVTKMAQKDFNSHAHVERDSLIQCYH